MPADQPSLANSLWRRLTNHQQQQQQVSLDYNDEDSLVYSVSVGGLHSRPVEDVSFLRTLELIRQLSFDTSMPKLVDICDAQNTTSAIKRLEPQVIPPPLHHIVVHNVDRVSASKTPSMSDIEGGYVVDYIPEQTELPHRRRLASDQSPYAVSTASITSCDDRSFTSSEEFYWDDPAGSHFDASEIEESHDDLIGPPLCTRLSTDSLQGWDLLCEQQGNVIDKMQYISTALHSSTVVDDQVSSYVGKVYMQTQQRDGLWNTDKFLASASGNSAQRFRPQINALKQEYDEAIASVGCLAFTEEATKKRDDNAQSAAPQDQGKKTLFRRRSLTLFKREKISPINLKISSLSSFSSRPATGNIKSHDGSEKMYPLSPDRTVATSIGSCDSGDDQEYLARSFNADVTTV